MLVLVSLLTLSSVVSLRLSFEIPQTSNILISESNISSDLYEQATRAAAQSKSLFSTEVEVITREPMIAYLAKQEKSPPGIQGLFG